MNTSSSSPRTAGITRSSHGHPGPAIRAMRTGADLSQRQLALLAGSSAAYVSLVERGERSPSSAWLWAMAGTIAAVVLAAGDPAATLR